jgi:nucleoid-associated protein YgaU
VSAFQKLFLATAILAAGLAVAILLGQPVIPKATPIATAAVTAAQPVALSPPPATATAPGAPPNVRLIPDADAPSKTSLLDAPALLSPLEPASNTPSAALDASAAQWTSPSTASPPRSFVASGPAVHLRNEAPRAIGNEPRTPFTVHRLPPVEAQATLPATSSNAPQIASVWNAPPTNFSDSANRAPNTPATPASFTNSASEENEFAPPPPQPVAGDSDDSQTHIVTDGDSLEKLAALYLNDPHRGNEIFELNRGILSDPNLLPIGAELKIPDRVASTMPIRQSQRPGYQGDSGVREAAMGDLIPVRSVPAANAAASAPPQAQLARPIAAD